MSKLKKIFFILFSLLIFFSFVLPASAVDIYTQLGAFSGEDGANLGAPNDPRLIAAYTIQIILGVLGVIFLAYMVYAGYLILLSGGNEEKITQGKKVIWQAVLGSVIILLAFSITIFVTRSLKEATSIINDPYQTRFDLEVQRENPQFYTDPLGGDTGMPDFLKF